MEQRHDDGRRPPKVTRFIEPLTTKQLKIIISLEIRAMHNHKCNCDFVSAVLLLLCYCCCVVQSKKSLNWQNSPSLTQFSAQFICIYVLFNTELAWPAAAPHTALPIMCIWMRDLRLSVAIECKVGCVAHTHTQTSNADDCIVSIAARRQAKKKLKIRLAGLYEPLVQMGFVITFFMFIHEHCRATTGGLCRGVCRFAVVTLVAFAPATGTTGGNRERHCTRVQFNGASRSYLSDHPNTHAMCLCMSLNCHFKCM